MQVHRVYRCKVVVDMWVAVEFGDVTVLFNVEDETNVSWLKKVHGTGYTREEAVEDLKGRLSSE